MFFTPSTFNAFKSSAIKTVDVNESTNQVKIEFNNGKSYLYSNVADETLYALTLGNVKSLGKWFNESLVKNADAFQLA